MIFKSCVLWVPPIFKKYARATLLSTWSWMVKFNKFFLKVRAADFNASSSATFMWKCLSSLNHFPCRNSLAVCSLAFCWGLCLDDYVGFLMLDFPPIGKFQVFYSPKQIQINSPVSHDHCRTSFSVALIFASVEDIETAFMLVKWLEQLMTTGQLILWDLRLRFIVAWKSPDIVESGHML